ncbi:hypothetical protein M1146_07610, partial [Patescibacteria group bacterium]|nr:hypothetical protein [Patescibacteria group bacterium]
GTFGKWSLGKWPFRQNCYLLVKTIGYNHFLFKIIAKTHVRKKKKNNGKKKKTISSLVKQPSLYYLKHGSSTTKKKLVCFFQNRCWVNNFSLLCFS